MLQCYWCGTRNASLWVPLRGQCFLCGVAVAVKTILLSDFYWSFIEIFRKSINFVTLMLFRLVFACSITAKFLPILQYKCITKILTAFCTGMLPEAFQSFPLHRNRAVCLCIDRFVNKMLVYVTLNWLVLLELPESQIMFSFFLRGGKRENFENWLSKADT